MTVSATYDEEAARTAASSRSGWSAIAQLVALPFKLLTGGDKLGNGYKGPDITKSITRSLESNPDGYPRIASFQSSDRSFMQFRGFLDLHCRVLLDLQFGIESLERELDKLDRSDASSKLHHRQKCLISTRHDREEAEWERQQSTSQSNATKRSRPVVLAELKEKLAEYDDFLIQAKSVSNLPRPSSRDYKSLIWWFESKKPLLLAEMRWVQRKEDIVALRTGRDAAGFEELVESSIGVIDRFLTRRCNYQLVKTLFATPELRAKTTDQYLRYYSPERIDGLVNGIITSLVLILLIIPVVVMWKLSTMNEDANPFEAIGILIVFTLLFGGAMCSLTKATRQEIFAASAAYCAVLVVFISNFTTQTVQIVSSGST